MAEFPASTTAAPAARIATATRSSKSIPMRARSSGTTCGPERPNRISVGAGRIPSEAVFVPGSSDDEEDGYLLAYVYDGVRDTSDLVILPAHQPDAPPVATVHLGRRVPFGFHGNWIPAASIP